MLSDYYVSHAKSISFSFYKYFRFTLNFHRMVPLILSKNYCPKSVLYNFNPKRIKSLEGDSFCAEVYFEMSRHTTGALWYTSNFFFENFSYFCFGLSGIIYGYKGLKFQTEIREGGYPLNYSRLNCILFNEIFQWYRYFNSCTI